jgi:hypothetical protein
MALDLLLHPKFPEGKMLFKGPIVALSVALTGVIGASLAYLSHERANERQMAALNKYLSDSMGEMQRQVAALNQKVTDLSAPKAAAPTPPQVVTQPVRRPRAAAISRIRRPAEDPRLKEMSAKLAEQQKLLAGTREELDQAKEELNGRLSSTRDELSTSIAKNHDQLVDLEKRGERTYYEFKLDKSKNFDRVGPIRLALRKADMKHKSFNMAMMIDDDQLQKKNVNLYEPVWVNVGGESLELVVNQIKKDHVEGYLSEPKYRKTESRPTLQDAARQP